MFTKMSYHIWRFTPFRPNDGCYGHFHGIVCLNVPIFHTIMHIGTTNNVDKELFIFLWIKISFSIFGVSKMGFFVKHLSIICYKIIPHKFIKLLYHIWSTNNQIPFSKKIYIHLFWKRQISTDSVETGPNLNYRCLVVCSWFFVKIIFRYTSIYFIRDTPIVPQYSTPRYECHVPRFDRILKRAYKIQTK